MTSKADLKKIVQNTQKRLHLLFQLKYFSLVTSFGFYFLVNANNINQIEVIFIGHGPKIIILFPPFG
ncbi:MAG: hypothetical protein A2328_04180 [Bdellovibrionales bacterium RIFOXYB2_FULL_36_6]|nr:MAG: hypothetical protein A2328_04180 [Bdellovibrionales bacterium RIFOXYB2_FULL_36_6]